MPRPEPPKEKRWKKGQSGNPQGGKKHNPEMKRIKQLTEAELIEVGSLVIKGSVDDLRAIAKDGGASALKCMIAAVAVRTISKGDPHALDTLLNRLIGKVKEKVELSGGVDNTISTVDPKLLKAALKKIENDC